MNTIFLLSQLQAVSSLLRYESRKTNLSEIDYFKFDNEAIGYLAKLRKYYFPIITASTCIKMHVLRNEYRKTQIYLGLAYSSLTIKQLVAQQILENPIVV